MSASLEQCERDNKFIPWLNETEDWTTPRYKLGLRVDAPEEARKAYAEYLEEKAEERRTGRRS
jgi:hypothetical protein